MDRRSFLIGTAATGVSLGVGSLLWQRLNRHLSHHGLDSYSVKSFSCFPVMAADTKAGLVPILCLQGVSFDSDPLRLTRSYPNVASLVLYSPSGSPVWEKIIEFDALTSQRIEIPDVGSFCTLHAALATSDASPLLPQHEVGIFMRMVSRWGTDGHHSIAAPISPRKRPSPYSTAHVIRSPRQGESVLVGLFNSFPNKLKVPLQAWDESGKLILNQELNWNPQQTRYLSFGQKMSFDIETLHIPLEETRAVLLKPDLSKGGFISLGSWMMSEKGFSMSHGFSFNPHADIFNPLMPPPAHLDTITRIRKIEAVRPLQQSSTWMTADIVLNGALNKLSDNSWESELIIPNLTDQEIDVTAFLFDQEGQLLPAHQKSNRVRVPARGLAVLESKRLCPGGQGIASAICHPGQKSWPNTLSKIFSSDKGGHFFIQHFRPSDVERPDEIASLQNRAAGGWASDYWISAFEKGICKQWSLQVRNYSASSTGKLILQMIGSQGLLREESLAPLAAGGACSFDLHTWLSFSQVSAIRILSEKEPVKVTSMGTTQEGQTFTMHGTHRALWKNPNI